jgi:hypothetical protein
MLVDWHHHEAVFLPLIIFAFAMIVVFSKDQLFNLERSLVDTNRRRAWPLSSSALMGQRRLAPIRRSRPSVRKPATLISSPVLSMLVLSDLSRASVQFPREYS